VHKNRLVEICNARFQEIFGDLNIHTDDKIIVSHFGEFSLDLVNSLATSIEDIMIEAGDKKSAVRRMFSIIVEALQNIRIHGERDNSQNQVSFIIVSQALDSYKIVIGNLVDKMNLKMLTTRIDSLNQMQPEEIKTLYMETLSNGIMSEKGGAGLGFITIALKSKNKIEYSSEYVSDELAFLTQTFTVERT
jgi:hypothetical protein